MHRFSLLFSRAVAIYLRARRASNSCLLSFRPGRLIQRLIPSQPKMVTDSDFVAAKKTNEQQQQQQQQRQRPRQQQQ